MFPECFLSILKVQTGEANADMSAMKDDEIPVVKPLETPSQDTEADEKPTVLIADDNADIRAFLKTIMQDKYQILETEDGKKGLEMAKANVPDIIVSDVMMPVMNGLEFCQRVKNDMVTNHIPVMLLTARALSQHQIEGYESGADAYITKPFSSELLLARIDNLLRNRHLLKDIWSTTLERNTPKQEDHMQEEVANEDAFVVKFKKVVEEHMANSDLGVEDIGNVMGLSRVQLYRKMKALTGCSPVDLLRKARLASARQYLLSSDLSVSEIAYKVGFSSPSYFTKCFKDEYGIVPGDTRKM